MAETLPLTNKISQSSSRTIKYNVLSMQFGNGYEQRTPDGLNSKRAVWRVVYNNLTSADRNTLHTFFDAVGSSSWFSWQPPGSSTSLKWLVDGEITESVLSGEIYSIAFTAKQTFDLD